jgi:hypothetical protein
MSGNGSLGMLASQATSVDATQPSHDPSGGSAAGHWAGIASSEASSSDYAMSLLARMTHASADQALALIQGMLAPFGAQQR